MDPVSDDDGGLPRSPNSIEAEAAGSDRDLQDFEDAVRET